MSFSLDPEITAGIVRRGEGSPRARPVDFQDVRALRDYCNTGMTALHGPAVAAAREAHGSREVWSVRSRNVDIQSDDGTNLSARWYAAEGHEPGSAVVYIHGGGMISGSVDIYDPIIRFYVEQTGVPFLAVNYRLAPECTDYIPAADALAAVRWVLAEHRALKVDPSRVALMGDSAGGGVAAGAVILGRASGVALAAQILLFPMLDDRNVSAWPTLAGLSTWTEEANYTGWRALLGESIGLERVKPEVAPARLADFSGLPRTYLEVGELDMFRDETVRFASGLWAAGISCELHVHPGAPHGYEWYAPTSRLTGRVLADRTRVITSL